MTGILAALDFGPAHEAVLAVTADLARAYTLPVHLVHVRPAAPEHAEHAVHGDDSDYAKRLRRAQRALDNDALRLRGQGFTVTIHSPRGDAAREIVAVATAIPARYLVLGAREPSALRHLVVGSIPAEVMRQSSAPVVLTGDWQRVEPLPNIRASL